MKIQSGLSLVLTVSFASAVLHAQPLYSVFKQQNFRQTSAAAPVADPLGGFTLSASAATNVTLTLPNGGTQALTSNNRTFDFARVFATKDALDAAFPNGTYRYSGSGIPTVSINLATDAYSTAIPQIVSVTNGAWNSSGVLVVDPAQPVTLNFNLFPDYAASGAVGLMQAAVTGFGAEGTYLETLVASQPSFGLPAQATPLTSFTIPAGRLTSGHAYEVWVDFDRVAHGDTTAIPGAVAVGLFMKTTRLIIGAQTPGNPVPPPVITMHPASQMAVLGGRVTFGLGVTVGGSSQFAPRVDFNWYHDGVEVSGPKYQQSPTSLTINNLTAADAGTYAVRIYTAGGVVLSAPATLAFGTASRPVITTQPRGATVNAGTTVALTVAATGVPTPAYQWRKDGTAIAEATADTLVLASVAAANTGNYTVVIANSGGTVTSEGALVTVVTNQPSRLPNLSLRTNLAANQTLTVGFVTNGPKDMLVRAVGPTLGMFGVDGVMADPAIELYDSASVKVDENNDWSASLSGKFTDVGAFALTGGSKDAALQRACTGAYSAQIRSAGAGVVLVEVYDAGGAGKLMNVSTRNAVGTGDNILIAGFVVDGTAAKTLIIRGVGAKLAEFGVTGVLADPKLEIYNAAGAKIAENDNWNSLLQPIAQRVGAFDLTPGSRDAAIVMTLAPGAYTAQIAGAGGTTGEALVEVYEVP